MKTTVTTELMKKVYALNKKGVDTNTIAGVLSMSRPSVDRVIKIMTLADAGDIDGVLAAFGKGAYIRQKQNACAIFGIDRNAAVKVETPATEEQHNNDAIFAGKVLELLRTQNELLERLCNAWGV